MNIQLRQFQEAFDEHVLRPGKQLFEQGSVKSLHEFDKNLWVARVEDGSIRPEVEILFRNEEVKNATCECDAFHADAYCRHITACLFALQRSKRVGGNTESNTVENKPGQLTTKGLLNRIPPEDLKQFVAACTRSDPDFALDLRIRFASKVDLKDNLDKYRQIIRQIKRKTLRSASLSKKQAQRMFRWLENLSQGARDAFISGFYSEAGWCYLAMIMECNSLWNEVVADQEKKLIRLLEHVHRDLEELFKHKKVPALFKDELSETAFGFVEEGQYIPPNPIRTLYEILYSFSRQREELILDLLKGAVSGETASEEVRRMNMAVLLHLWSTSEKDPEELLHSGLSREDWLRSLDVLVREGEIGLIPWYHLLFRMKGTDDTDSRIARKMIRLERLSHYPDIAVDVAEHLILEGSDARIITTLEQWPEHLKQRLLHRLEASDKKIKPELLIRIAHLLGKGNGYSEMLAEHIPLNRIQEFKKILIDMEREELLELLDSKIDTFLQDHFGQPAKRSIRNLLVLLNENGRSDLARELVLRLNRKYKQRTSFHIEVDDL